MDFFDRQEKTRRRTGVLLVYFTAAVIATAAMVYVAAMLLWFFAQEQSSSAHEPLHSFAWWQPQFFLAVFVLTLIVIVAGSLVKIADLRRGGSRVAEMLGGRPVSSNTDDFFERRLLNVVEEMAIASGMTVPPVYILPREKGVNAFAAGYTSTDAIVAVTYGTMVGLSREELQGVIAHEFSHILNGDMRLNIHLMGGLYGLLLIVLAGRAIFQIRARGKGAAAIYLTGGSLILVGSIGLFFCKLIKSAISRQREFLADAAAVQFTRNPAGLAGALKKIGGLSGGSRLLTSKAEGASHMFFGEGMRTSFFSTHPPLAERIRWLEPAFDGKFEHVELESLGRKLTEKEGAPALKKGAGSIVDVLTRPAELAVTGAVLQGAARRPAVTEKPVLRNPEALMASIGAPLQEHVAAAGKLIESIPPRLREMARDPYGARAVVYLLLLDPAESVRAAQISILREKADADVVAELEKAVPLLDGVTPEMRLPVFDLAMPALRQLSQNQYLPFRANLRPLIDADGRVSIFEYALQRVLVCHLDPLFSGSKNRRRAVSLYAFCGVQKEISCVLSVLARLNPNAAEAFEKAATQIPDNRAQFSLLSEAECGWEQLDAALDKLGGASFYIKKWALAAALVCLMNDRDITVEEVELFRAMADSLDCPVPSWLTAASLDD